ncbi:hypothetical protein [Streptomyces sp. cmx-10-25]|uniref:hypothetical protein n=1 Tax=Streptomyces sp. cmx-10-25 TaxID=2790919 RepID=UPI00397FAA64
MIQHRKATVVGSTVLQDQDVEAEYEVTLRFNPGGPAVLGAWSQLETAEQVFMEWLGLYGREGTVLTLTATAGDATCLVKSWTYEGGLQAVGAV